MCKTLPCKVLLPQIHTWRNINTRFTTQRILWKRTSRCIQYICLCSYPNSPQVRHLSPDHNMYAMFGYIKRIHVLDFLGQSLSHLPFFPPYACHKYNEMWLNCYKFLRLCEYKGLMKGIKWHGLVVQNTWSLHL